MTITITPDEVRAELDADTADPGDAKIASKIERAVAIAGVYAPCIKSDAFTKADEARALILGAVVYDLDSATRKHQSQGAGPFQKTEHAPTRSGTFYSPSQIKALQALCPRAAERRAYSVRVDAPEAPARPTRDPWGSL